MFRGNLARLTTAGQAPLALDAYRLLLASLSPFPVFLQYTMLWTVANGAIGQQTFEAYAAYIQGQHTNILAHSNLRPFAGNIEGYEDGVSKDDGMGGDSLYPTFPQPSYPQYLTANAMQPYYPPHQPYPPQQFIPPPPGLGFNPYPYPMANGFTLTLPPLLPLPLPTHPQTRKATDRKEIRKTRKARHRLRQRQGHLTPISLVPLCLALLNCTFIAASMAG
jgi:hypothetical protein